MKIHRSHEVSAAEARTHNDLATVLQHAFKLEHATLLPYFTAIFSLHEGENTEVEQQIRWVAMEEMLHMMLVANLINALGQQPLIDSVDMVPSFPGPLPMGVAEDLTVSLMAYSVEQVRECFMAIEQPEDPMEIDTDDVPDAQSHSTIGRFYGQVRRKLIELGDPLPGGGNVSRQVTQRDPYTADELFPVTNTEDAVRAVEMIVHQGEGTTSSPANPIDGMAHYYRFQELANGRRLVKDDSADLGWSFTGEKIPFDPDKVWPIAPDTRLSEIPDGTEAKEKATAFAEKNRQVLTSLHFAFNGHPDAIGDSVDKMKEMQKIAYDLCATPFPGRDGVNVGPTWEFS